MEAYCIKPNAGCPALVSRNGGTFTAVIATDGEASGLTSVLQGALYLQSLDDTRQVIQNIATADNYVSLWKFSSWPEEIRNRLVPLEVVQQLPSTVGRGFRGILLTPPGEVMKGHAVYAPNDRRQREVSCSHTVPFALRLPSRSDFPTGVPQLFNLVRVVDDVCVVSFHAVYVHERAWSDFSFLHVTDPHLAWRNDLIPAVVRAARGQSAVPAQSYRNFNDRFRDFIAYANELHRNGMVDFILLTGDIVDFVQNGKTYDSLDPERLVHPADNFQLFLQTITGWPTSGIVPVGEELEVPVFTCPGNHDYRLREYALAGYVDVWTSPQHTITEYRRFGISWDDAIAYQEGRKSFEYDEAGEWVDPITDLDASYCGLLSPDPDFAVSLGKHRVLSMDTGRDAGVVTGMLDYLGNWFFPDSSSSDFLAGSPDSVGFSSGQVSFLEHHVSPQGGLVFLGCHAPPVNPKSAQAGFSYRGPRDPDFGVGVATNNFDSFVAALFKDHTKHVDLILSGHTHSHRELQFEASPLTAAERLEYAIKHPMAPSPPNWYQICGGAFSDSLLNAANKAHWWLQQPAYLIQTPWLPGAPGEQPFGFLRIVVEDDVISRIEELSAARPWGPLLVAGESFLAASRTGCGSAMVKINGTGGTGGNMLAIQEQDGLITGVAGYDYWVGSQQFRGRVMDMVCVNGETIISLSDGRMLKVRGTGGTGQNMFAIQEAEGGFESVSGYDYIVGSQALPHAAHRLCSVSATLFVALTDGTLLKINGTGGTGTNMFAIQDQDGLITGLPGYEYWVGTQQFPCRMTDLVHVNDETIISLSDGRMLKVRNTGGTGQNMFAIQEAEGGFGSVSGYDYLVGSQVLPHTAHRVCSAGGVLFVALSDGSLLKINGTGGTAGNMFAIQEQEGLITGVPGYDYWLGTQRFPCRVADFIYVNDQTIISLDDGRMLKVRGTGGTGQNMFAIQEAEGRFESVSGYDYLVGSQVLPHAAHRLYYTGGTLFVALTDGTLLKINGTGGTGTNMFAIQEDGGVIMGIPGYSYWLGTQQWSPY